MKIVINNQNFTLHHSGAAFWEEKKILLISDVHLGKVAHFRKNGIGIPEEAIYENFLRLNTVLEIFKPEKVIFLGDLFHSRINNDWNNFVAWKSNFSQQMILVEGNHDIIDSQYYAELNIQIHTELVIDNFMLTHHPTEKEGFFNFCGHIHPAVKLRGAGRQFLSLSCFFRKPNQLIFPAFGVFTGRAYLIPSQNDTIYAITQEAVLEVSKN